MSVKFLRYPELKLRGIPFSRQHIANLGKVGRFPKAVNIGEATLAFVEAEIDAWAAERIAERDALVDHGDQAMEAA
jgi:prophage regulatory protein